MYQLVDVTYARYVIFACYTKVLGKNCLYHCFAGEWLLITQPDKLQQHATGLISTAVVARTEKIYEL
jgi:hypothetical protein